ncbi:MAG: hypothetical protein KDD34_03135 [Bdellovibrionales bacterium]|nr:hypothetical protein [Bdellovibrionales bacterium]
MIYVLILLIFPLSFFLSWWGFIPACFLIGFKSKKLIQSFFISFFAMFFVWGLMAYLQNMYSHGLMAQKMAHLFHLPWGWLMIFITAITGALLGGIWGSIGLLFQRAFWNKTSA